MAFEFSVISNRIQHINDICRTERERRKTWEKKKKKKKKYTQATLISPPPTFKVFEEQPYFRYHSNPSSVSLFFRSCVFFFSPLLF